MSRMCTDPFRSWINNDYGRLSNTFDNWPNFGGGYENNHRLLEKIDIFSDANMDSHRLRNLHEYHPWDTRTTMTSVDEEGFTLCGLYGWQRRAHYRNLRRFGGLLSVRSI